MKKRVLEELQKRYGDNSTFQEFFQNYILNTITDSDILKELNKKGRNLNKMSPLDYLDNESILIRAIKVCVLLELSKNYEEFCSLDKKVKKDKETTVNVEFEKLLKKIIKGELN